MTLIAAFKDHGNPLLIGDFLISRDGKPSDLKKKIYLICPNLVIGWADSQLGAQTVLNDLYKKLGNRDSVSRKQLENFLLNYDCSSFVGFETCLIGWVIESEPHCFSWNSKKPGEINYEDNHNQGICKGSGAETFKQLLAQGGRAHVGKLTYENNVATPIAFAFKVTRELMEDEIKEKGRNLESCFGYAFEILYYEPGGYKYVDNTLFLAWDFYLDDNGKLLTQYQWSKIYKYRNCGNYSAIGIIDSEKNESTYEVVAPICGQIDSDRKEVIDIVKKGMSSLYSDRYCLYFRHHLPNKKYFFGTLTIPNDIQYSPLSIKEANGIEKIQLDRSFIENWYKNMIPSRSTDDYSYYK